MRKAISAVVGTGTIIWIWATEIIAIPIAGKITGTVLLIIAMGLDIFDPHGIMKTHKNPLNWVWVTLCAGMVLLHYVLLRGR